MTIIRKRVLAPHDKTIMPTATSELEHAGVVMSLNNGTAQIRITTESACGSCQAKAVCGLAEVKDKIITVTHAPEGLRVGAPVTVVLRQSLGLWAVLLGYILPLVLLIATLLVTSRLTGDERVAGMVSLAVLVPYYTGLYLTRHRVARQMQFTLKQDG